MKERIDICNELKELFFGNKEIIAVWEGGSAATGYLDEYSDLDLGIVCNDEAVEDVFTQLEVYLQNNFGIVRKFRMPEPTWHGFSQCFYQIANVPDLFYLDIGVMKKTLPEKLTESDRHGDSQVWFEKEKILDPTPTAEDKAETRCRQFYKNATQADFIIITELKKAIARKNFSEAFPAYFQFIARNLGIMLNLKYRPRKVDFGLRYSYRDYPQDDAIMIENFFKVKSIEELAGNFVIALKVYTELKEQFAKIY